ncbi:hypothetical protein ISN44_As08g033610 [Arabidopsis suecica]|uniref:Uncharacterized protein n=1 Tax=Arabidopsis suecica TaxID=45249 RepID=A0A8T2BCR4_ARASU|nr:hypothetical protein ISN44_As08g033610 [Arabidopsis suecica]
MSTSVGSWMWKILLKYITKAKAFHKMEIRSGLDIFFGMIIGVLWVVHDLLGDRGFINLGMIARATVSDVLATHRHMRHQIQVLNAVEMEIDKDVRGGDDGNGGSDDHSSKDGNGGSGDHISIGGKEGGNSDNSSGASDGDNGSNGGGGGNCNDDDNSGDGGGRRGGRKIRRRYRDEKRDNGTNCCGDK